MGISESVTIVLVLLGMFVLCILSVFCWRALWQVEQIEMIGRVDDVQRVRRVRRDAAGAVAAPAGPEAA